MTNYSEIFVKGPVETIQDLVQQAFLSNGFNVKWDGPGKGKAEKGSSVANLAVGALAQHYEVDFEILPTSEGGILRLHKGNKGLMGGLIGMEKVNKEFSLISDTMVSWFAQQGLLINVKRD
jgi:hypothetical protein